MVQEHAPQDFGLTENSCKYQLLSGLDAFN